MKKWVRGMKLLGDGRRMEKKVGGRKGDLKGGFRMKEGSRKRKSRKGGR